MSLGRSVSAAAMLGQNKVVRRLDRPRPLKFGSTNRLSAIELSSVEDVVVMMENVCRQLNARNYDRHVVSALLSLCATLKKSGPQLEHLYKDQLDKLGIALRNACRDDELDLVSRVHLLEIIELRAMNWQPNENVSTFYKQKLAQLEYSGHLDLIPPGTPGMESPGMTCQTAPVMLNPTAPDFSPLHSGNMSGPLLGPGEVVASSGRFGHPTKIPGKNYYKDEVVIRNADSGKVMGLKGRRVHMIEELTETIISFQRVVPGARERLVQITGPAQDNILQAKSLIEDTIRRNQSPLPREEVEEEVENICSGHEVNDSKRNTLVAEREVPIHEYKYTVNVGEECIRVTGASLDLVRTAKLVLDEYFSLTAETKMMTTSPEPKVKPMFSLGAKTAFSPITAPMERQTSVTSPGKRSLLNKSTPTSSPFAKNINKRLSKPEISYDRSELLKMSMSPMARTQPKTLPKILEDIVHIVRKSQTGPFHGLDHMGKGLNVFSVDHYIRPYAVEGDD